MILAIDDLHYSVRITEQSLHFNRKPVLALCDHSRRELVIHCSVDPARMPEIIGEAASRIYAHYQRCQSSPAAAAVI